MYETQSEGVEIGTGARKSFPNGSVAARHANRLPVSEKQLKRLRNRLYHDYILRMHVNILEAVTTRLFGENFAHRESVS